MSAAKRTRPNLSTVRNCAAELLGVYLHMEHDAQVVVEILATLRTQFDLCVPGSDLERAILQVVRRYPGLAAMRDSADACIMLAKTVADIEHPEPTPAADRFIHDSADEVEVPA